MSDSSYQPVERTTFQYGRAAGPEAEVPEGIEITLTKVGGIPYFEMVVNGENLGVADKSMNIIDIAVRHVLGKRVP